MRRVLALLLITTAGALAQDTVAVVNGASFRAGPVAPGSLASAFGNFTGVTTTVAAAVPLGTTLGSVELLVNNTRAPLLAVTATQINFQVPGGTAPGRATVRVTVSGTTVASGGFDIAATAAGMIVIDALDISRPGAVLNQDSRVNGREQRARRGEVIQIFATGQGATRPPVPDGAAGPVNPLADSVARPVAFAGVERAEVLFSGISTLFPGLWQVNIRIPAVDSIRDQVPLFVALEGRASNPVTVWVER